MFQVVEYLKKVAGYSESLYIKLFGYVCMFVPLWHSVLHGSGSVLACETFGSTRRT